MNILLLAFALPIATILLAIVLQKVLKCPLLVAATFFAVLLIITYTVAGSSFLIFAILYTILAYVTALLTRLVCNIISNGQCCNCIVRNAQNESNNQAIILTNGNNTSENMNGRNIRNGNCCCRCGRR